MQKKDKPVAFQFYPRDYLSDINVEAATLEEEGVYIRLLCYCWLQQGLPSDLTVLCQLAKGAAPEVVEKVVRRCFKTDSKNNEKIYHPRLKLERKKQLAHAKKRSAAGQISGKARRAKTLQAEQVFPLCSNKTGTKTNSSISISTSISNLEKPGDNTLSAVPPIVEQPAAPAPRQEPELAKPPELWNGFVFAARKAGMTCANGQVAPLQRMFADLPLEERRAAIRGIEQRLDTGEYADAHFVPAMKRYLGEQLWTAQLRPGAQVRARPPTRQERVRSAIDEAKKSLQKEPAYASG